MRAFEYKGNFGKKGQITVEYLLLAVVFIVFFGVATNTLKNNDYLANFQKKPGELLKNMVENGNLKPNKDSKDHHPNQMYMHWTPEADDM